MADEDKSDELKDPRSYSAEPSAEDGGEGEDSGKGGGGDKNKKKDDDKKDDQKKDAKKPIWPWIVGGGVALVFVLVVLWIILAPHARQRTDDAFVTAHFATIAPRVAGQVSAVTVTDNQPVRAGQLLLRLDDRDFRAALAQAEAALASDQANVLQAQAQVARQPALIRQAEAQVSSAAAKQHLSSADQRRYANLASTGAGTVQQHQEADATLRQDQASLVSAEAELIAQRRQLDALRATEAATIDRVGVDQAEVARAQLNLSYTRILAPIDGVVDQRQVQVGNYVSPGAAVMTVVPLEGVYVIANYRELALRHMRPGQPARIHVDAYDMDLDGVIDSLPPSSGAAYSPIPPNNASGNFTKIVQRLPVKVVFVPRQRLARLVRVGMSVEVTIDTRLEDVVTEQRTHDRAVTGPR